MNIVTFDGVVNEQSNLQDIIDLIKILQWYHHGPNFIFLDDNTIHHNTHIIIISDVDIPLIEWPTILSNSIEQLWDMLKPCLCSWFISTLLQKQHVSLGWGLEYHVIKKNILWLVRVYESDIKQWSMPRVETPISDIMFWNFDLSH